MAAQPRDVENERRLIAAAARSLAADAVDGHAIAELLGADEQQLYAVMAETVRAWRDYLTELSPPLGHDD